MAPLRKLAVVTGTSSGIGLAVARRLADEGWRIVGIDRIYGPLAGRDGVTETICDLADLPRVEALIPALAAGRPAVFVHCAGLMRDDADSATAEAAGSNLWALHVGAPARIAQALLPAMPDVEGRVLFVSSRAALGRAGRSLYSASKAALDGLARSLAIEVMARGITVNVIAPGATDTPQLSDPKRADARPAQPPVGRLITAEEVAALAAFLIGPMAGAITGQTIFQCGGASLAVPQAEGRGS